MSEAPETIWAFPEIGECVDAEEVTDELRALGITEYRRAGLPPTLSAAMELSKVQALKDALSECLSALTDFSYAYPHMVKGYMMDAEVTALAALAAIKEPKP